MNRIIAYFFCISTLLMYSCQTQSNQLASITEYNVLDFGAKADTNVSSRAGIQAAIDEAAKKGGGTVVIPPGDYMTGGIEVKSNITLNIMGGATLWGTKDLNEYSEIEGFTQHGEPTKRRFLITTQNAKNVTICGKGIIDGQGLSYWENSPLMPHWIKAKKERPNALVEISESENVTLRDITLQNSPNWTCHILHSTDVAVEGIRIINSLFAPNADGIDITGSKDVRVANCDITTCDDGVVLKTWKNGKPCEDVTVTNCTIETLCAALKLGTESYADYRRVTFSNCAVKAASRLFAIYVRDGCLVENVAVSNIVGNTKAPLVLNRPIQVMITKRNEDSKLGHIRNVFVDNMICKTDGRLLITADDGSTINNFRISNLHLDYPFIEDPEPVGKIIKSGQFPQKQPHLITKRASIVAKNMSNFKLDNFSITWPEEKVPTDWQIKERLLNGDFDLKFKHDYSKSKQTDLEVFYGEGMLNSSIDLSGVKASDK